MQIPQKDKERHFCELILKGSTQVAAYQEAINSKVTDNTANTEGNKLALKYSEYIQSELMRKELIKHEAEKKGAQTIAQLKALRQFEVFDTVTEKMLSIVRQDAITFTDARGETKVVPTSANASVSAATVLTKMFGLDDVVKTETLIQSVQAVSVQIGRPYEKPTTSEDDILQI